MRRRGNPSPERPSWLRQLNLSYHQGGIDQQTPFSQTCPSQLHPQRGATGSTPIIFESLDASVVRSAALRVSGAAGPSGLDAARGSPICERFSRMRLPVIAHVNIILYTGIFYHVYSVNIVMHYMSVYTGIELPRVCHHDKITTVGVILHNTLRVMLKKVAQLHTHFENHLQWLSLYMCSLIKC